MDAFNLYDVSAFEELNTFFGEGAAMRGGSASDEELTQLDDESSWGTGHADDMDSVAEVKDDALFAVGHSDLLHSAFFSSLDLPSDNHLSSEAFMSFDHEDSHPLMKEELVRVSAAPFMAARTAVVPPAPKKAADQKHAAPAPPAKRKYRKRKSEEPVLAMPQKKVFINPHMGQPMMQSYQSAPHGYPMGYPMLPQMQMNHLPPPPAPSPRSTESKQTSTFRGVSCCGKDRKWQARIRDSNRVRYLGRFGTEVEAALVYDDAARELKGDKAPTNFVPMDEQTRETLKIAFVTNNNVVPEHLMYLVVRPKAKKTPDSPTASNATPAFAPFTAFPDSPMAKVKGTAPAISPTAMKSTAHKKPTQLQSLLDLDFSKASSAQGKFFQVPPHLQARPGALNF